MSSPTQLGTPVTSSLRGGSAPGTVHLPRNSSDEQDQNIDDVLGRLEIENRLKEGAENLLQVLDTRTRERPKEARDARRIQVTEELNQTNVRIAALKARLLRLNPASGNAKVYRTQRSDEKLSTRPKLATIKSHSSVKYISEVENLSNIDRIARLCKSDEEPSYYIAQANEFVRHLSKTTTKVSDFCLPIMTTCFVKFCSSGVANVVSAGYRMARYMICDGHSSSFVMASGLERCLIISLSKDHRFSMEKEQAIKFIRALCSMAPDCITKGIIRALVSIAETQDRLALIALESLAEMTLALPQLTANHGVYRCLLDSLIEGPIALADEIAMVFVNILDRPVTRKCLRAGRDLEVIFAPFTDFVEGQKQPGLEERLMISTTVVARMLNTWPGLLGLSMFKFRGLKSIVDALRVPASAIRLSILEFFFNVLAIPLNNMSSIFLAGRRLTTLGRTPLAGQAKLMIATNDSTTNDDKFLNLANQFAALKLQLFLDVGILDALMMVIEDNIDLQAARKATLLLGELLQLSNTLLPLAECRTLQTLPRLFSSAVDLKAHGRYSATAALFQIESLDRTRNRSKITRFLNTPELVNGRRGQRQVEQVKIKMGLQIDDSHFRNLLLDTQVLSTKNYTKWHWDTLTELVQGPLLNSKRLEESIRATKFMKRLLAFYRPFTHRFSAIRNTRPNRRYVRFGCLLLNTLLSNAEGIKYLTDSKLLRQLSECLAQVDPMVQMTTTEALFSVSRMEDTLCHGYFDMIGVLTAHPQGIAMMERWRMFSTLYHLADLRSRGDLIRLFLTHMDYSHEGHPRIIMSKALTTGLLDIRLFATEHLSSLIIGPLDRANKTANWAIRLLVIQLYDTNTEVCETAVRVLRSACSSREHLQYIVHLRPALEHLGEIGGPLLLRFLATSVGYHYLSELHYIDQEIDNWFHVSQDLSFLTRFIKTFQGRNDEYVTQLESALLNMSAPVSSSAIAQKQVQIPLHFYGELASTDEGVALLLAQGHFDRYVEVLQTHWRETVDLDIIHKVKAALWAIGSIGATERGAHFLKDCQVIMSIIDTASKSQIATLKGTAYLVLGMLSTTKLGTELLMEHKWVAVLTSMGEPTGICVPRCIDEVLNLQTWPDDLNVGQGHTRMDSSIQDPLTLEIIVAMSNLSNHILANDAAKALLRLRQKYPNKFMTSGLYDRAFSLLSDYGYKLGIRKFMLELFEPDMLQTFMLRHSQFTRPKRGYSLPKDINTATAMRNSSVSVPISGKDMPLLESARSKQEVPRVRSHRAATIGA